MPNAEIAVVTGLRPGTAAPALKELRDSHMVSQTTDRNYFVAEHQLEAALAELEGTETN
jgi:hypothetical protein